MLNTKKLVAALVAVSLSSAVFAANMPASSVQTGAHHKRPVAMKARYKKHHRRKQHGAWDLGLRHNLKLDKQDATIITRAALLVQGFKQYHVSAVQAKQTKRGRVFLVDISNKKNKIIRKVIVSGRNGHIRPWFKKKHKKQLGRLPMKHKVVTAK